MKITVESTTKLVELNGVPARVWEGVTDSGIPVHCFITRVAAKDTANLTQFEAELKEQRPPSLEVARAYPLRMVL
jgi:hypothetical protein